MFLSKFVSKKWRESISWPQVFSFGTAPTSDGSYMFIVWKRRTKRFLWLGKVLLELLVNEAPALTDGRGQLKITIWWTVSYVSCHNFSLFQPYSAIFSHIQPWYHLISSDIHVLHDWIHWIHWIRGHDLSTAGKDSASSLWRFAPCLWTCRAFSGAGGSQYQHPQQPQHRSLGGKRWGGKCQSWKMWQNWPCAVPESSVIQLSWNWNFIPGNSFLRSSVSFWLCFPRWTLLLLAARSSRKLLKPCGRASDRRLLEWPNHSPNRSKPSSYTRCGARQDSLRPPRCHIWVVPLY